MHPEDVEWYPRDVGAGILPTFVLPGDVRAVQTAVAADLETVRAALQKCADAGTLKTTQPEWNAFQALKAKVAAYVAETPSYFTTKSQMDRGEALQREVASWHDIAAKLGCNAGPTPAVPAAPLAMPDLNTVFGAGLPSVALILLALYLLKK